MILVTGGTGTIGREVIQGLVTRGASVRALVRSPAKAKDFVGVEIVHGDLDDVASVRSALAGIEVLFLLTTANVGHERTLLTEAKAAGVKRIVKISSLGASPTADMALARGHAVIEEELRASGLAWTILRPGMFAQNLLRSGDTIRSAGKLFGAYREGKVSPIDVRDIAAVAVEALLSSAHDGEVLALTGPEALTYAELAGIFTDEIGKEVAYVDLPPDVVSANMVKNGLPQAFADDLVKLQTSIAKGQGGYVSGAVPAVLGRPARSFRSFVREHAAAFR